MSTGGQKRTRSERVAALELPPSALERALEYLRRGSVLGRIALSGFAALLMWWVMGGWAPAFSFRSGEVPQRNITARITFYKFDPQATDDARGKARLATPAVYVKEREGLVQKRAELVNIVVKMSTAKTLADLEAGVWEAFLPPAQANAPTATDEEKQTKEAQFQRFRDALAGEEKLAAFKEGLALALAPFEQRGLMAKLPPEHRGSQTEIDVIIAGKSTAPMTVPIPEVLIPEVTRTLNQELAVRLQHAEVADRVFTWLTRPAPNGLPTTLVLDLAATERAEKRAADEVQDVYTPIESGAVLAKAGEPLTAEKLDLLRLEHETVLANTSFGEKASRSLAGLGMFLALFVLCGFYIYYREPRLLTNLRRFSLMLALATIAVGLSKFVARDEWRAEMIPLLLFGMTMAIAYQHELALLLSAAMALVVVIATGQELPEFVILLSAAAGAILQLGRIRSRSKLLYVGIGAGAVALLTTLGVNIVDGRGMDIALLKEAGRNGLWAVVAGFIMLGILPAIENLFEVLTDLSLLELGDVSHPLLQELVRRAPGTYNHSINVASIAEAAAESIGAHGLLTRVGAYFHDIGKMLKPSYFAENQGVDASRHETLLPAMSTLIIIAHIKDGADLARQHHLPQPIIDFIQQHHGTTLVEYFFHRASERSESDPNAAEVEESSFRYPGPKPQTKECGVLMLADAVESASRALVEPTPARLESLVEDISMKRLLDGQFDECGLTLEEVHLVEDSLVKSLTAVYHGRVKYPEQVSSA